MLFDLHTADVDDAVGRLRGVTLRDPQRTRLGLQFVLARSFVAASITGTTVESTLASIAVPGGLLGPNGFLRLVEFWSYTNNANTKTLRARLGGQQIHGKAESTSLSVRYTSFLAARGNEAQQLAFAATGSTGPGLADNSTSTSAFSVLTVNAAVDQVLTLTAQLANAGDTATLEGYILEIMPG